MERGLSMGCLIVCRPFLITSGHPTKLLEPIDQSLHSIALAIGFPVKGPGALLVGAMGNGRLNAMTLEVAWRTECFAPAL